jgi:hypothetical protein
MALTTSIKRAPRWAWYTAGGIGLGAVAIQVYRRRAVETLTPGDATNDAQVIGTPGGGSAAPSPVITPPVIIAPNQDSPDFAGMFAIFGDALNNTIATVGQLATGDQGITTMAVVGGLDLARESIASAGQAPAPAATPIIVQVPTPTTPAVVAPPAARPAPACSGRYPYQSARGCYRVVLAHGERWHYYGPNDSPKIKV